MINTKTFRLFISSTFSDFTEERRVLQTKVFPQIRDYCARKGGFSFQAIDLRWGVSQEAQLDQKTLDLCLNEVYTCKSHPAPNFMILAGDRYGWIPLPYIIEKTEMENLMDLIEQKDRELLLEWYQEDRNQIPVSYILKERTGEYCDYDPWEKVETAMRNILQKAVNQADIPEEQKRKYFLSATEAEVMEGILEYGRPTEYQEKMLGMGILKPDFDTENVFAFIRNIQGDLSGSLFEDGYAFEVNEFKENIRKSVRTCLESEVSLQDSKTLEPAYLAEFEERTMDFLKKRIDRFASVLDERTEMEEELLNQKDFAELKRKNFQGQKEIRQKIYSYLAGEETEGIEFSDRPLIIYGPSGRGKSALMAMAIEEARNLEGFQIHYRFIGVSPHSSTTKDILMSLFEELGVEMDRGGMQAGEQSLHSQQESFEDFSERARNKLLELGSREKGTILFIDAVDQLINDDSFLWLPDRLPDNVRIVISALDDENYQKDSRYYTSLKRRSLNFLPIPPFGEPLELMTALLVGYSRKLQPHQEAYLLEQYNNSPSPLFLTIASQELRHWKSFDPVENQTKYDLPGRMQDLADSQQGIINEYILNLSGFYHHNRRFVEKVLGYILASGDGLSESELIQLLSADRDFVREMAPETWHKNPTGELPTVIWSRLQAQLSPFLRISLKDGEELISFFHREFSTVIGTIPGQQERHLEIIEACQQLVSNHLDKDFEEYRWGKLYLTLATGYQMEYQDEERFKEFAGFVAGLGNDEWIGEFFNYLIGLENEYKVLNYTIESITLGELNYISVSKLYKKETECWVEDYTISLNTLALSYNSIGRTDEAIELEEESLGIRKELYKVNPEGWAEDYTTSLNNLANSYRSIGRTDEAIELGEESLGICKELYKNNPDRWAEDYTTSLGNLAYYFESIGRIDEAIELQEESLRISKELYQGNPDRWAEDYTTSLNNLANSYRSIGRTDEAIELGEESLGICKELYKNNPDRWAEDYTTSLNNLANSYEYIDRTDEAIKLGEESLYIRKELYKNNPDRWA